MAGPVRLSLLGQAVAHDAGGPVSCPSRKSFALFAFLALDRRKHTRRALAALLWGSRDAEAARASLRATLFRLPESLSSCLSIERETLSIGDGGMLSTDVQQFERGARAGTAVELEQALALYGGHLLHGFDADATPEFDDWLDRERARLKRLAYDAFDRLIGARLDGADQGPEADRAAACDAAVASAQQWLALDPAAERAHQWLIRAYLASGRGDSALAQYELCERALAVVEGRAPAPQTRALLAAVGDRPVAMAPAVASAAAHRPERGRHVTGSPAASTSFVGRLEELAELARLLDDPACRLVTLHGLGGVGKTRLADALARQVAERFAHGVSWVTLEGVERSDAVADSMARALGVVVPPRAHARDVLIETLRGQERLLIVDNVEQLLGDAGDQANDPVDLLLALLREAPRVRIVVTSRETLGVQEEWVYAVEGLAHADAGERGGDAASLPAIDLFSQRARQAYLGFSPAAELPHMLAICAQVDGLPLGIELAAAWVRTIPCAEIAKELERGLALGPGQQRNRPDRQRSLRAVVEFSWQLLTPEQQEVLAALSEFRGGFTREAATQVAKASLRVLSALVDKALLRRGADARFSLHPLVRMFAAEKLALSRGARSATRARHRSYYLRLLGGQRLALYGADHLRVRQLLEEDLDNLRAAWQGAVEDGDAQAQCGAARPLCVILDRLGLYEEWTRTFDVALDACATLGGDAARAAQTRLLIAAANGHWRRGDAARALTFRTRLADALAIADDADERAELHKLCGLIEREAGNFDAALAHFAAGTAAAREANDAIAEAQIANECGVVQFRRGDMPAARAAFLASASIVEAGGYTFDAPTAVHNVGYCDLELGEFASAQRCFDTALERFRERDDVRGQAMVLSSLGVLARRRGDHAGALAHARSSLALAERSSNRGAMADALDDVAQAIAKLGDFDEARAHYRRALAMARELGQVHLECFVMLHLARAEAAGGDARAAAASLHAALKLAGEHDFQTGRLMGLAGAAHLRLMQPDPAARDVGAAWCRAALAAAGGNTDVRDAIPEIARALLDGASPPLPAQAVDVALAQAIPFLRALAAGEFRAQAPP